MKRTLLFLLTVGAALTANAQFLTKEYHPNGINYLPQHPKPTEMTYYNDYQQYLWGKTQRAGSRGDMAKRDAKLNATQVCKEFSEPMGITLSSSNTPEIYKMVEKLLKDGGSQVTNYAKNYYMRTRPFMQFNETSLTPDDEASLRTNGSYPSGHTSGGWAVTLVLAEINPDNQDAILARGYEYGQSRVICGVHYQSDVDAGRLTGSACVARLHADEAFMAHLARAKAEFQSKKK